MTTASSAKAKADKTIEKAKKEAERAEPETGEKLRNVLATIKESLK